MFSPDTSEMYWDSQTLRDLCENHGRVEHAYHVIVAKDLLAAEDGDHHQVCRQCLYVLGSQPTPVWVEDGKRKWRRYVAPADSRWPSLPSPREVGRREGRRLYLLECPRELAMALKAVGWRLREVTDEDESDVWLHLGGLRGGRADQPY